MLNLKNEKGQSIVEFALVLPILLMLVFSIIDFGMLFAAKNQLEITSMSTARSISLGNAAPLGVTVSPATGYTVGDQVMVTSTTSYTALTPVLKLFFGSNVVPLTNTVTIVIEQPPA